MNKRSYRKKKKNLEWWQKISIIFFILFVLGGSIIFSYKIIWQGRIYSGVKLGSFYLGGKTTGEAFNLFQEIIQEIDKKGLIFTAQNLEGTKKRISVSPMWIAPSDPDLSRDILTFDLDKTIEKAYLIGRRGNFLQQITEEWRAIISGQEIYLEYEMDTKEFQDILKENFRSLEKPAKNAELRITKDHKFWVATEKNGYGFDYKGAIEETRENLKILEYKPVTLRLVAVSPQIKKDETDKAFEEAYEIAALEPIILKFKEEKWEAGRDEIEKWLEIKVANNANVFKTANHTNGSNEEKKVVAGFNQEIIYGYLKSIAPQINIKAKDAKFEIRDGKVAEFQISQDGQELDLKKSWEKIEREITREKKKEVELVVEKIEPQITVESANTLGIKELVGRGESNFKGSPKNRRHNIKVGSERLHGLLIEPNKTFSLVEAIGKVNKEAGYLPELVIKGDKTIPEYGGGLCQIGTTTFRVALDAGFPIVERQPHSYRVSYYEPAGTDAAVYSPHPDLKFINDTGHHILFQTKIEGDKLIFEFWGTRDGRKVEMTEPKIFNIKKPLPTKIIETEDLPPGKKKCTEISHNGADTLFERTITYPNGEKKEEKWRSHYKPWQAVCLVGKEPKKELEETEEEGEEEEENKTGELPDLMEQSSVN